MLDDCKYFAGLSVQWVVFGPNELDKRPLDGGVIRHYNKCTPEPDPVVKTIVNSYFVEEVVFPHNQRYR